MKLTHIMLAILYHLIQEDSDHFNQRISLKKLLFCFLLLNSINLMLLTRMMDFIGPTILLLYLRRLIVLRMIRHWRVWLQEMLIVMRISLMMVNILSIVLIVIHETFFLLLILLVSIFHFIRLWLKALAFLNNNLIHKS